MTAHCVSVHSIDSMVIHRMYQRANSKFHRIYTPKTAVRYDTMIHKHVVQVCVSLLQIRIQLFLHIYDVTSKYSRNHFTSEKYKTVQSFKLYYHQDRPHVLICTSPATVKLLETFLEAIMWKAFQLFRRNLNYISSVTKPCPFNADFSWWKRWKSAGTRSR
jgi:hypothetical protein